MGADGSSTAAIKLFEAQIISGLLFNRKLMHLPISTPKRILHWDGGMEMMKWRIAKSKLMFLRKLGKLPKSKTG